MRLQNSQQLWPKFLKSPLSLVCCLAHIMAFEIPCESFALIVIASEA